MSAHDPLDPVRAAFDPERFRREGHALVDRLADYLGQAVRGEAMPVLPYVPPAAQVDRFATTFPGGASFEGLLDQVIAGSNHLHHPRYVGHQVTAPLPVAALCDLVSSLMNNGMAVYEMGPVVTALERVLIRFFADALGLPAGAGGVLTSGGSAGNLTALLAARQAKAGFDVWSRGVGEGPPLGVLCSSEAHYSIARALKIMGLGARAAVPVPVDAAFRMRPEALPEAKRAAEAAGLRVIAVCASAGATATGSFDPLEPIADFCAREDLWLHVDGAHGASLAWAPELRGRLRGIERADSVIWDAHKMMLMPALTTAVLFREGRRSHEAFAQEASYLFASVASEEQWWNVATRTLECTKLMMSLKLYAALSIHGPAFFGGYVAGMCDLATRFAARLTHASDFELAVAPACNIVCFRHVPAGVEAGALDALQNRIRRRLVEGGGFYLVQTTLPRGVFLRVTLINPFTTLGDLEALLGAVRDAARED